MWSVAELTWPLGGGAWAEDNLDIYPGAGARGRSDPGHGQGGSAWAVVAQGERSLVSYLLWTT